MNRHPRLQPAVTLCSITGPFDAGWSRARRRAVSASSSAGLATRARRKPRAPGGSCRRPRAALTGGPVTDRDHRGAARALRARRARRSGFDAGIEVALRAILTSPEFLFRIERDPSGAAAGASYRISDLELASRLSFFLWSSIPDDRLLDAAERGRLREPAVLDAEVRRMLADPRAEALTTNFASQWLHLRNLAAAVPNLRLYPDFDDNLRQAFRRETELFFQSIVQDDRSVLDAARRRLHVPERTARQALRHAERLRRPVPPRRAAEGQRAPRAARATAAS